MQLKIFSLLTVFVSVQAFCQETTVHSLQMDKITLFPALRFEHYFSGTMNEFRKLAPSSVLVNNNFAGYRRAGSSNTMGSMSFSAALGFKIARPDKAGFRQFSRFNIGLTYYTGQMYSADYYKTTTKTYDTLNSTQGTTTVYLDSIRQQDYSMSYLSDRLALDASFFYGTDPERRFSVYTGIGILAGRSLNATVNINKYDFTQVTEHSDNGNYFLNYYGRSDETVTEENFKAKNNTLIGGYIPAGVNFRIANKGLLQNIQVFYEARPGLNLLFIPGIPMISKSSLQHGFGIRIKAG